MVSFSQYRHFRDPPSDHTDHDLPWWLIRRRMIAQTEAFINEALVHPELAAVIPTIPVGSGTFTRSMSAYFWRRVLGEF